jgi:hypothetical protein
MPLYLISNTQIFLNSFMLNFKFDFALRLLFIWIVQSILIVPFGLCQKQNVINSLEEEGKINVAKRNQAECVDINCIEGQLWQKEKRSVIKLLVYNNADPKLCTCTLLNNTAKDGKPYVLTAQHCISNQDEADQSVFIFNFESLGCDGAIGSDTIELRGAKLLVSSYEHDYALLELYTSPPSTYNPYYSGWDFSDDYLNNVTSIHHPWGTPKKISRFYGTILTSDFDDNTSRAKKGFWNIKLWDRGTTDYGSSGGPLFNSRHLLIGTLTGGSADCNYPYNDYFSRFSSQWNDLANSDNSLRKWLDPIGSGVKALEGLEGGKEIIPHEVDQIVVYPNPTSLSTIMVNFPFAISEAIQIRVVDSFAKEHLVDFQSVNKKAELNLSGLPNGLYFLNVVDNGKSFNTKFIKGSFY